MTCQQFEHILVYWKFYINAVAQVKDRIYPAFNLKKNITNNLSEAEDVSFHLFDIVQITFDFIKHHLIKQFKQCTQAKYEQCMHYRKIQHDMYVCSGRLSDGISPICHPSSSTTSRHQLNLVLCVHCYFYPSLCCLFASLRGVTKSGVFSRSIVTTFTPISTIFHDFPSSLLLILYLPKVRRVASH